MAPSLSTQCKIRTNGTTLLKYKSVRAFYDAMVRDQNALSNKLQIKCLYASKEFLIFVEEKTMKQLILTLNALEIPFLDENSTQIYMTNVPVMMSATELEGYLLPHFRNVTLIDLFRIKAQANSRSAKVYLPEAFWNSDEGKELIENLKPIEGERYPTQRIQLESPYFGVLYMRLWLPKIQQKKYSRQNNYGNQKQFSNQNNYGNQNTLAPKYAPSFDPADGRLKFDKIKLENKINENINTENKGKNQMNAKSPAYYESLLEQQKQLLEKAEERAKSLETLVDTVTMGFSSIHEILHTLNESVHQLVKRVDILDSNIAQNTKLQVLNNLNQQKKFIERETLLKPKVLKKKCTTLSQEKSPKQNKQNDSQQQDEMEQKQEMIPKQEKEKKHIVKGTKLRGKTGRKKYELHERIKNMRKRELSLSKSPGVEKRQKLQIPSGATRIMRVLAELKKTIPVFMGVSQGN